MNSLNKYILILVCVTGIGSLPINAMKGEETIIVRVFLGQKTSKSMTNRLRSLSTAEQRKHCFVADRVWTNFSFPVKVALNNGEADTDHMVQEIKMIFATKIGSKNIEHFGIKLNCIGNDNQQGKVLYKPPLVFDQFDLFLDFFPNIKERLMMLKNLTLVACEK